MLRYREDLTPLVWFLSVFCVDVAIYLTIDAWWVLVPYALLSLIPKASACASDFHSNGALPTLVPSRLFSAGPPRALMLSVAFNLGGAE